MFCKLKTVVSFLRVIVTLLSLRPFENNLNLPPIGGCEKVNEQTKKAVVSTEADWRNI